MPGSFDRLPPAFNFRPVLPGRLYRSAEPVLLAPHDWTALVSDIGLTTVVDLRMTAEQAQRGLQPPTQGVTVWSLPLFEEPWPGWSDPEDRAPRAAAARYLEMLETGASVVRRIAALLKSPEAGPTLVHCAAGRDRTGIVVACLLALEGWSDGAIATDYALSDGVVPDGRRAEPATMRELLALVRRCHGSVDQLLIR